MGGQTGTDTSTQKVTSNSTPWAPSVGHLGNVLREAGTMFNTGQLHSTWADDGGGKNVWQYTSQGPQQQFVAPGTRFARPDQLTLQGGKMGALSAQNIGQNVNRFADALAQRGGYTADQNIAADRINQLYGARNPYQAAANRNISQQGPNASMRNLSGMAAGNNINSNPHLEAMISRASEDARNQVGLTASRMGRYGSGVHQGAVADAVMDASLGARMRNYESERGRQLQANEMIDRFGLQGAQQRTGALGQASNMWGNDMRRMQDVTGQQFNMGQQALGNMQGALGLGAQYGQALRDAGGFYTDLNQKLLEERMANFNEIQRSPRDALEWYSAIAQGAGRLGGGGTQTTVSSQPSYRPSTGQQMLGTGLSFLSGLF